MIIVIIYENYASKIKVTASGYYIVPPLIGSLNIDSHLVELQVKAFRETPRS